MSWRCPCGDEGGSLATLAFGGLVQAGPWAFVQMSPEVWSVTLRFTLSSPRDPGDCLYLPFSTFTLWQMSWLSTWFLSIGQKRTSEFLSHHTETKGGAECCDAGLPLPHPPCYATIFILWLTMLVLMEGCILQGDLLPEFQLGSGAKPTASPSVQLPVCPSFPCYRGVGLSGRSVQVLDVSSKELNKTQK